MEPSHSHSVGDLECGRGWEWWLVEEARRRNSKVATYALPWGFPYAYDKNQAGTAGFDDATIEYFLSFLNCSHAHTDAHIDYLGFYNEVGGIATPAWTIELRKRYKGPSFLCFVRFHRMYLHLHQKS